MGVVADGPGRFANWHLEYISLPIRPGGKGLSVYRPHSVPCQAMKRLATRDLYRHIRLQSQF